MLTRCATRNRPYPCALTASLRFQAGGSRKLLAQDPGGEKELSYGDIFLQSYEKCARSSLLTPLPQQPDITRAEMHPHIFKLLGCVQGTLDIVVIIDPTQMPAPCMQNDDGD